MASQTQTHVYAASSDSQFAFSAVSVSETDTVPGASTDFTTSVVPFLSPTGGAAPGMATGPVPAVNGYDGLTWAAFNAGSFAPGDTVTVSFSYTVTALVAGQGISSIQQAFSADYFNIPDAAFTTAQAVETVTSGGSVVGSSTIIGGASTSGTAGSGSVALNGVYSSVTVTVSLTLSIGAGASTAAGIDISRIDQGFATSALPTTGSIGNFVWNDLNNDGIFDNGEVGVSGITVDLLNSSGAIVGVTTTDATGHYLFSGLNAGSYQVAFLAPVGYSFTSQVAGTGSQIVSAANVTTGKTAAISLAAGQTITLEDAGLVMGSGGGGGGTGVGAITTHVYLDTNADGTQGAGETNLAGVTVVLLNSIGAVAATTTTDANGNVSFAGLTPGSYQVAVTTPAGDLVIQHTNVGTPITVVANQTVAAVEGVTAPATFTTHVYLDSNGDGTQSGVSETNLAGVTVQLLNSSGVAITGRTAVTDVNGNVSFIGLVPGGYQVSVAAPAGDVVTQNTNTLTTNILASGQTANAIEGVYIPATFTTHVYFDSNADGVQGTGETNLAGVTVALLNGSGVATGKTAVTDGNGNVSFAGLAPGSYEVAVTTPSGDIVKQATNVMTPTTLASGQTASAIEGVYAPASFTTHVYYDSNADGTQGTGETNLAGVTVALLNGSGVATGRTAITDVNGNVSFSGLVPGSYEVSATTPSGDIVTQNTNTQTVNILAAGQTANAIVGLHVSPPLNPDVSILKTVTSVGGVAGNPAVTYAGEVITYNIVVTNTGNVTLTNVVVTDPTLGTTLGTLASLAPGVSKIYTASQVATQTQINNANASVRIYAASGTGADGAESGTATITVKNDQIIIVLSSGQANPTGAGQEVSGIRFTLGNTPISASLTSASGTLIDIAAGGCVTSNTGVIDHWGVAQSGATLTLATAGAGSVGGKPTDLIIGAGPYTNANPSITGRNSQITGPATFVLSAPGVTLGTTISSVGIEFGTGPDNVLAATQTGSTVGGAITNTAVVTDDQTASKSSTASTAIAGGSTPATFNTHVYYDSNADGTQGTSETNLAGVTVALLNGSGVATGQTAVTDANGNVSFAGLAPGSYEVAVTTPVGDIVKQATNVMTPTTLVSGQTASAIEGVYAPATFTTHVFFDTNANGVQDTGDTNLAGVTVALLNGSGVATGQTAITDANGNVSFTGLVPGSYEVAVTTPAGDTVTTTTNVNTPTTLLAGQTGTAIEGVTKPAGLATFTTHVYYDTNKDGVQSGATETNLAGVTVTLLTGTGASTGKTAITNAAGNVSFAGLAPGSYEVAVTTPTGDVVTKAVNVGTPNTLVAGGSATAIEGVVAGTPGITVDKSACVTAVKAVDGTSCNTYFSTVTYTYKVTNSGNTALNNVKLVDNHGTSLLPDNISPVSVLGTCSQYNVGDSNHNGVLDVGETWSYQAKIIETGNYVGNPSTSATTSISGCSTQGGETIWLSSVLKSYQTTDGTSYAFKGVTANVHLANGTTQSYSVPDSYVTFSNSCTSPGTTWDAVQHAWITTLKAGCNPGNVFMTGVPITVPAGTNMNGATVSMTVNTAVSSNGATAPSWAISTSAYDNFKTSTGDDASHDYSKIGVKACDNGDTSYRGDSSYDKAGTPGGAEDNHGGSNYNANYGWNSSRDDYGNSTYSWGCTGYSNNYGGSGNTGSTGYSATTTMHMTALSDSTVIDNVTVSAQTICPTGYGGGSYSGSGGDDGYRGGYYGNGSSGDDGHYRNGSYGSGERDDGGNYANGTGCYSGSGSYGNDGSRSYGSYGDNSYNCGSYGSYGGYGGYSSWGDYGGCNSYSSSYNYGYGGNYGSSYGSSSSSDGKTTWDSARSVWTDDKSSSTGYYGSGIDDREVSSGGDKIGQEGDYSKTCGTNGGTTTSTTGCVVTTVTGSDMQNVQVLATNNIQLGGTATTGELKAAFGAATKLEFTYSPSDVVSATNLQNGIAAANGHNTDSLAFIEVTNSSNPFATGASVYFAGTVATGAKFIADATVDINNNLLPGGTFSSTAGQNLYAFVFADQATFNAHAAPIQTIVYDATGGNGGMHINDQIGSIKLAGYVGATGHGYLAA